MQKRGKVSQSSILIITVWSLFLLTTLAMSLGLGIWQRINLVERLSNIDSLHFTAEAGINIALAELGKIDTSLDYDALNDSWSDNPSIFKARKIGQGEFTVGYDYVEDGIQKTRYGLTDEESKININTSNMEAILRLIQGLTEMPESVALELAYCIVDWRDSDSFYGHPTYGAEDSDYKDLKDPYEAKDSGFETIDELFLVKGMNQEIFSKIEDYITIYGDGRININTATRVVLLSLGLSETVVNKILSFRNGADMASGTLDDGVFISTDSTIDTLEQLYQLTLSEKSELESLISRDALTVYSDDFMIKSTAKLDNRNMEAKIIAVANRERAIKYWRED